MAEKLANGVMQHSNLGWGESYDPKFSRDKFNWLVANSDIHGPTMLLVRRIEAIDQRPGCGVARNPVRWTGSAFQAKI